MGSVTPPLFIKKAVDHLQIFMMLLILKDVWGLRRGTECCFCWALKVKLSFLLLSDIPPDEVCMYYLSVAGIWTRVICCCCLVIKSCPTLCDSMDQSTPGPPVFHCLPEFGQIHVGSFDDTVQPSRPLSSPSPLALTLSQPTSGSPPGSGQSTGASVSGSVLQVST